MHVIYMSVNAGVKTADRTDRHGRPPPNRLTCPNWRLRVFRPRGIWPEVA
jgi:hypothetical protein